MEKITKTEWFNILKSIVEASDFEDKEGACAFIDKQVEIIASKAEKAKERAAAKKADGDKLRTAIETTLTNEFQTIAQITQAIVAANAFEDVTNAKVSARLSQLVKLGLAEKEQVKEGSHKVMGYRALQND